MPEPIVTVVIPNYNGEKYLPHLMESLAAQSEGRLVIVVVDDGSTDNSVAYLRERWPAVRLICNERNVGFAGSCNAGLRVASTPFVALLNNDTHVAVDWLAQGLRPFRDPRVASVASLVLLADETDLIDTAGDVYSVVGGAVKRLHLQPRERACELDADCFSASGASAFYRRAVLLEVGLLDERFESYYEDIDLGFRLAWAGYHCELAPGSVCYHHLSSSYNPRGWGYHFNSARNAEIVWWSHLPAKLRRRHALAHLCFCLLQGINKLRQGCLRPYLAGKWAVGRHLEHIREKRQQDLSIARLGTDRLDARLVHHWWRLHLAGMSKQGPSKGPNG